MVEQVTGLHNLGIPQYIFGVIILLVGLFALGLILTTLLRPLWHKNKDMTRQRAFLNPFAILLRAAMILAMICRSALSLFSLKQPTTEEAFQKLLIWGRRSGVQIKTAETPAQYCYRLGSVFSAERDDIQQLHNSYTLAVYGLQTLSAAEQKQLRQALQRLYHPRLWGQRIKNLLFGKSPVVRNRKEMNKPG